MTPLPGSFGQGDIVAWRLDQANYAATWDSGEGAYRFGGRWNTRGMRAVYSAVDPATAILEMAVHKGFAALDTVPHVLSAVTVVDIADVHIVHPTSVPNPNWLRPGIPGRGQQSFGDELLERHRFVLIPARYPPTAGTWSSDPTPRSGPTAWCCKSRSPSIRDFTLPFGKA